MRVARLAAILGAVAIVVAGAVVLWQRAAPVVETATPSRGPAIHAVYATGVVEPVEWAKVGPLVRGRIVEVCACEGQSVAKGEPLARLDDREARAQLAELEARTTFAAREVERYRALAESRTASPQTYERAMSELAQARAAVAAARERLDHLTVRAPIAGVVLRRDGEVGEVAGTEDVLFWVGKPQPIWIVGEVDEEDIARVAEGQRVLVKADAFPGRALEARVARITPKGDPINKNFRVRLSLPPDSPLMIGMTVEANLIVEERAEALLVPAGAVVGDTVWIVRDGRAQAQKVEPGIVGAARVEILSGLGEDATIIVDPPAGLRDGARVRPRPNPGS